MITKERLLDRLDIAKRHLTDIESHINLQRTILAGLQHNKEEEAGEHFRRLAGLEVMQQLYTKDVERIKRELESPESGS